MKHHPRPPPEELPDDLLWSDGGHASDVVLTSLADGQDDIVPARVRLHVEGCRTCSIQLGNAALLSLHVSGELDAVRVAEPEVRPFPRLAVALGLVAAAIGFVPTLLDADSTLVALQSFLTHDVPLLLGGLGTLLKRLAAPGSPASLMLPYIASALLLLMAFALVRVLPKKEAP